MWRKMRRLAALLLLLLLMMMMKWLKWLKWLAAIVVGASLAIVDRMARKYALLLLGVPCEVVLPEQALHGISRLLPSAVPNSDTLGE